MSSWGSSPSNSIIFVIYFAIVWLAFRAEARPKHWGTAWRNTWSSTTQSTFRWFFFFSSIVKFLKKYSLVVGRSSQQPTTPVRNIQRADEVTPLVQSPVHHQSKSFDHHSWSAKHREWCLLLVCHVSDREPCREAFVCDTAACMASFKTQPELTKHDCMLKPGNIKGE